MISICCGLTGQGKTLYMANKAMDILNRNLGWYEKTGKVRQIAHNFPINPDIINKHPKFFKRWKEVDEIHLLTECDIFWDEVSNGIDSSNWQNLSMDIKSFLRQHEKRGCDIYGTAQRWKSVDINFRSLVSEMYVAHKIIGSRRPSATKPQVKRPWGLIWLQEMNPKTFEQDEPKATKNLFAFIYPNLLLITKERCNFYDTRFEVSHNQWSPLKHIVRYCTDSACKYHTMPHITHG